MFRRYKINLSFQILLTNIKIIYHGVPSNIVVEWLTLLFRIREVPVSNVDLRPVSLTEGFRYSPQSLQANARILP
jgi:hypothetical protein